MVSILSDRETVIKRLKTFSRLRLVSLPTPLEPCRFLKDRFQGCPNIYFKRDDDIGYLVGGNKVRKLEYVMADAVRSGATAVVTMGSVQSNHARTTAMVTRRLGLKCELVLNGDPPDPPCANFLINDKMGIPIHLVTTREERTSKMEEVARRLEAEGEKVYRIPLGASDMIGVLGFVGAFAEILSQEDDLGIRFDRIVISSSSGGTQAGLEIGKRIFGRDDLVISGVSPDDPPDAIKQTIQEIGDPVLLGLSCDKRIDTADLEVDADFIGEGYGIPTQASEQAARLFSRSEGILLDPIYTAKAAAALLAYCQSDRFEPDENVLFWHTGGLVSLFRCGLDDHSSSRRDAGSIDQRKDVLH